MNWRMFALALLFCTPGCSSPEGTSDLGAGETDWRAELMEADRAFNDRTSREGAEGWASFFAPSGTMIVEGVGEIRGVDAIRDAMAGAFSDPSLRLTWEPLRAEVSVTGDLGYTVGRFLSVRDAADGEEVRETGLYVSIWRRQPDGSWKVEMDLGNPTEAPPEG